MSSTMNRLGASNPVAPQSSRNPLQRIRSARQQQRAAKAERQAQKQYLTAQMMAHPEAFAARAPTVPAGTFSGRFTAAPGAPRHTASGSAQWDFDAMMPEQRGLKGAAKRAWRRTQRVDRGGKPGVSKRRYWKGIATAGCAGLAAGLLILSAVHIAVAALAVGCIGFMAILAWKAFKKQTA